MYGTARFLHKRSKGIASAKMKKTEWVGPLCSMPGIMMSMSGSNEAMKSNGRFTLTFRRLEVGLPVMYPRDMCPTANINISS